VAAAVAASATVSGEPVVRVSHWETGKAGWQALTREPGDLPALSPNRWAEGPYGAAVRSGDAITDAKARMVSDADRHVDKYVDSYSVCLHPAQLAIAG